MLTYIETARLLGLPVGTVYALVHQRRIPHVRLGPRLVRFRKEELDEWIARQQVAAIDAPPRREVRR
jgi:excisionase family DNA binding protein